MSSKRARRRERKPRRREFLSLTGILFAAFLAVFGGGLAVLAVLLLTSYFEGGFSPFDTVGIARPTPVWMAVVGMLIGVAAGLALLYQGGGYLWRAITGQLPQASAAELERLQREEDRIMGRDL